MLKIDLILIIIILNKSLKNENKHRQNERGGFKV